MEGERIYGGFHLGVGTNTAFGGTNQTKWHIDASRLHTTAWFNGQLFVEDGEYRV